VNERIQNTINNYGHLSILCINIYYYIFFSLNGIFDTELVHLYLSDRVQMSIKYHYDPEMMSLTIDIRAPQKNCRRAAPLGAQPPPPLLLILQTPLHETIRYHQTAVYVSSCRYTD